MTNVVSTNVKEVVFLEDDDSVDPVFDRARLTGTNVNPDTLLATDYLNHFNEVAMVLEMLPMAPDCFDEIAVWEPRSYVDHFAWSALRDADIAIEAYGYVAAEVRAAFDAVVNRLNEKTQRAIDSVRVVLATEDKDMIEFTCAGAAAGMRALIDEASGIINGTTKRAASAGAQDAINAMFD